MNEWMKFLNDTMVSYQSINDNLLRFIEKHKFKPNMPCNEVKELLLNILDDIDTMIESSHEICSVFQVLEKTTWEMSLEQFNHISTKRK